MRAAKIYFKGEEAGLLTQHDDSSFTFRYHPLWVSDSNKPSISLTLPKIKEEYQSDHLFPFFYNMLPEGSNKRAVSNNLRIDKNDDFGLLLITAIYDSIGAVTVRNIE